MPSSHATLSVGIFVYVFLAGICRTRWRKDGARAQGAVRGFWQVFLDFALLNVKTMNLSAFLVYSVCWGAILLPVPWSRVRVHDHSVEQVSVGAVLGVAIATVWSCIVWLVKRCIACRKASAADDGPNEVQDVEEGVSGREGRGPKKIDYEPRVKPGRRGDSSVGAVP